MSAADNTKFMCVKDQPLIVTAKKDKVLDYDDAGKMTPEAEKK